MCMTNGTLQQALELFCQQALMIVRQAQRDNPRVTIRPKVELSERGWTQSYVTEPDWTGVFDGMHAPIRTTESYSRAEEELKADPQIASHLNQLVGDGESMIRIDTHLILRSLVLRMIDKETAEFSEEAFRRA